MMISEQSYFIPKSAEHGVTLTSFTDDLTRPPKISFVRMCDIDKGRGMQNLVEISAFVNELTIDKWRVPFLPHPPWGVG